MRWSQVRCFLLGLIAYIYGVSVVLSRTAPTTRTPAESCGLTEFDDVESRVVAASVVVDAIVNDLRRIERTSSSVVLYQAHLTVIRVLKGRLERSGNRPRGLATITVGTFARASRRFGTIKDVDDLCASFGLPVDGSRYIVYLSQPNWSSDVRTSSSSRRLVYNISSSLEPYSANKLNVIQRCSRRRYRTYDVHNIHKHIHVVLETKAASDAVKQVFTTYILMKTNFSRKNYCRL